MTETTASYACPPHAEVMARYGPSGIGAMARETCHYCSGPSRGCRDEEGNFVCGEDRCLNGGEDA